MAAAFFAWTVLLQAGLALAILSARDGLAIRELDTRVENIGELASREFATRLAAADALARLSLGRSNFDTLIMQVRNASGQVVAKSSGLDYEPLDIPLTGTPATYKLDAIARFNTPAFDAERVRAARFEVRNVQGDPYYLEVFLSMGSFDRVSRVLSSLVLVTLALGSIGAAIAGWIVSGATSRRLHQMSRTIQEISPTRLDERITLPVAADEIGRMSAAINGMLERMDVAFRSQERFMAEVSHELKTPVSALLTEAQVLKYMSPDIAKYRDFVLSAEEEMRRLGKLVESLLMLARFGHGKQFVAESVVAINDVAVEAADHASLYARQTNVRLELQLWDAGDARPEALVKGDQELLRIVIDNLVRNAISFSRRSDPVILSVECTASEVVFSVRDFGPGVPPEYIERIFERFAQAPGAHSTRRGSGLGLTIAKSVITLHGGTILARNHPEKGCVFEVRLPLHLPAGVHAQVASLA